MSQLGNRLRWVWAVDSAWGKDVQETVLRETLST